MTLKKGEAGPRSNAETGLDNVFGLGSFDDLKPNLPSPSFQGIRAQVSTGDLA
jgi:hypothetical protein